MTFLKYVALGVMALVAIQVCSAQSKFPLRSGEWQAEMSVPGSPNSSVTMLYCLNDALWQKALTQDPLVLHSAARDHVQRRQLLDWFAR